MHCECRAFTIALMETGQTVQPPVQVPSVTETAPPVVSSTGPEPLRQRKPRRPSGNPPGRPRKDGLPAGSAKLPASSPVVAVQPGSEGGNSENPLSGTDSPTAAPVVRPAVPTAGGLPLRLRRG